MDLSMQRAPIASSTEDHNDALRVEQLRLIFGAQHFNITATLAITAVVAVTLMPVTEFFHIAVWVGAMLGSSALRIVILLGWQRDPLQLQHTAKWWRYLLVGSAAAGMSWGLGNFLLFPPHDLVKQIFLIFITAGVSSAAAVSLAPEPRIAWIFLLPCILPMELKILNHSSGLGLSLAGMGFVYLLFLVGVIKRLRNYVDENVAMHMAERERERIQNTIAQALHSSQEKLQALFELSPLGCILLRADGVMVEANQSFRRMLGYEGCDFGPFWNEKLVTVSGLKESQQRWQALVASGGTDAFECDLVRRDGTLMPASIHRMVIDTGDGQHYVWALVEDITERKRQEQQHQALNNRLSLATQAGGIGVWELDVAEGTLLWDVRMSEIYGMKSAPLTMPYDVPNGMVHPDDWSSVSSIFFSAMQDRSADRYVTEFRIVRTDDTERWLRTAGIFLRDELGQTQRVIGVAWDITELKNVARMKSEFVSSVSHELRTPLTSIRGSLGLVASGAAGEIPAAAKELVDIANKNSERLSLLIDDILDIEKIESGKMRFDLQKQALTPLLEQALEANMGYAQTFSVNLQSIIDRDTTVVVDANRFMQVMANLISNAVKFSNTGGTVEIAVVTESTRARIEVRDRGPGIPMQFREHIFQRFSQADSSDTKAHGGSGLGLSITKTLVERMHGALSFSNRVGGGTIFYVELPQE